MKPQGEVRIDNAVLVASLLAYYRKSVSDENKNILKKIIKDFKNDPKNIPHDIDRFCRYLEMDKNLMGSLKTMSPLERILTFPRKGKKS